jgi:hypothetical protein
MPTQMVERVMLVMSSFRRTVEWGSATQARSASGEGLTATGGDAADGSGGLDQMIATMGVMRIPVSSRRVTRTILVLSG